MANKSDKIKSLVQKVTKKGANLPNIAEVVEAIMVEFGGPRQLAREFYSQYKAAKSAKLGSLTCARLLEGYIKMIQMVGNVHGPRDLELVSDEDLEREADTLARKIEGQDVDAGRSEL